MATLYFRSDGWVKSAIGPAVPGSQIYVCAPQPANVNSLPPSPLATVYSDPNGLVPITQPILTDGFGHYDFYVLAGIYTLVVGLGGVVQQVYPDQNVGGGIVGPGNPYTAGANITIVGSVISATGGGGSSVTLQTNGVSNTDQALLNLHCTDGTMKLSSDGVGGVNLQATPTPQSSYTIFGNIHGFVCNPDAAQFNGFGATAASPIGTYSSVNPTATDGPAIQITSQAIPNGQGVIYNNNNAGLNTGSLAYWQTKAKISAGSGTIWYAGMSDVNPGTTVMPSTLTTQNAVAFRWVTGNANFKCVTCDGGGTETVVDSGVPVDTAYHLFQIFPTGSGSTITFKIDGATVGTITTHIPTNTTVMGMMITLQSNALTQAIQFIWWSF